MVRRILAAAAAAALAAEPAAGRAESFAHALTISGQASGSGPFACATSGPAPGLGFFGAGVPVPAEGHAGCGLAGGIVRMSQLSGLSTAHSAVNNAFNGGLNVASADAAAEEGSLGVSAAESFAGGVADGFTYSYAEGAAMWSDPFAPAPGGGLSLVRFRFDIDGAMTADSRSDAFTRLVYQVNSEPIYTAFVAEVGRSFGAGRVLSGSGVGDLSGFTVTPTALSGAGHVFSFFHALDLSAPFELKVGLYSAAYVSPNGATTNDFFNTAKLGSVEVYDSAGRPLDMSFTGASGTVYDINGAHRPAAGIPEPGQWSLMILGFALAGAGLRRRQASSIQTGA